MKARQGLMRCLLLLVAVVMSALAATATMAAGAAEPVPRLRVSPLPDKVRVGQVVPLEIAVLVPGWFTAPVELPASFVLDGASVRLAEGSSANLNERIEGVSYAGIRRRYELVATRTGTLTLPPIALRCQWNNGTRSATHTLSTPPLSVNVTLPPGMEGLDYFIATPRFELSQTLDRPLTGLKAGDAFTRTLTLRASGLPAMQLPALQATAPAGLAVYPDEPLLETTRGERGAADQSLRRQRFTYVLQAPGDYELPGLALSWFDTGSDKVRVARVPALSFSVRPGPPVHTRVTNPSQNPSAVSPAPTWRVRALALIRGDYWRWGGGLAGGLCVLAALGALCWGYRGGAGWLALRRLRGHMLTPERRAFLRSLGALAGARQAAQQLQAIESWRVAAGVGTVAAISSEPALWRLLDEVHGRPRTVRAGCPRLAAVGLLWRLRWRTRRAQAGEQSAAA